LRRNDDIIAKQGTAVTSRAIEIETTKEHVEKRSGERNRQISCTAEQVRAGWEQVVCGPCFRGSEKS